MQPPRDGNRALAAVLHIRRLAEAQERYGTKLVPRRVPHETEHGCRARRIQEDATCGRRYGLARATRDASVGHGRDHPRGRWRQGRLRRSSSPGEPYGAPRMVLCWGNGPTVACTRGNRRVVPATAPTATATTTTTRHAWSWSMPDSRHRNAGSRLCARGHRTQPCVKGPETRSACWTWGWLAQCMRHGTEARIGMMRRTGRSNGGAARCRR